MSSNIFQEKQKWYPYHLSRPESSVTKSQVVSLISIIFIIIGGLIADLRFTLVSILGFITLVYFAKCTMDFVLTIFSFRGNSETQITNTEALSLLKESRLPVIFLGVTLYKEPLSVVSRNIDALVNLIYPTGKKIILFLIEKDDRETQTALELLKQVGKIPDYLHIVYVDNVGPRTKPKAQNWALSYVRETFYNGSLPKNNDELVVFYDAEDIPEPYQLLRAQYAWRNLVDQGKVKCIQGKLSFWNATRNWLTAMYAMDYGTHSGLRLPGLSSLKLMVLLGGTSNFFPVRFLMESLYNPYNVTEDAELSVRISREGFLTVMLDSVTWEEANTKVGNMIRQRSRWVKGYLQTWFYHMRNPIELYQDLGFKNFIIFHLQLGATPFTQLVNPIVWLLTAIYLLSKYSIFQTMIPEAAPFTESLFPWFIFYPALGTLIWNMFNFYFFLMGGLRRADQGYPEGIKQTDPYWIVMYTPLVIVYWTIISMATYKAFWQLITNPSHWEKTDHGFEEIGILQQPVEAE